MSRCPICDSGVVVIGGTRYSCGKCDGTGVVRDALALADALAARLEARIGDACDHAAEPCRRCDEDRAALAAYRESRR